jgi:outer membrane protein assembly factor BamB
VDNGVVYVVSYQGRLAALNMETGIPNWERELSSYAGFALSKSVLYVSDAKGSVLAIDRRNGKNLWEQSGLQGRRLSKPEIVGNDVVLVGDEDGYLHGLSAKDGSFLTRVMVDSKGIEAPPLWDNNRIHVLGRGGKIAVYRLGA